MAGREAEENAQLSRGEPENKTHMRRETGNRNSQSIASWLPWLGVVPSPAILVLSLPAAPGRA